MMLKVIMQDTLLNLTENSYKNFVDYVKFRVPKKVNIIILYTIKRFNLIIIKDYNPWCRFSVKCVL